LAAARGIHTTEKSILQTMYAARHAVKKRESTRDALKKSVAPPTASKTVDDRAVTQPVASVDARKQTPAKLSMADDDVAILKMLADVRASLELIEEEIIRRAEKRKKFKELLSEM
jgi:hypothetical protein